MKRLVLAGVFLLAACGDDAPPPVYKITVQGPISDSDLGKMKSGLEVFQKACAPLFDRYWSDVVRAEARINDPKMNYTGEQYGWTGEIWIEIQISEKPKRIPRDMHAWGHTLHYLAGGSARPGLIAKKEQSSLVCNMGPSPKGDDVYKAVEGFAVLGGIGS